jgi:hypothetical protein
MEKSTDSLELNAAKNHDSLTLLMQTSTDSLEAMGAAAVATSKSSSVMAPASMTISTDSIEKGMTQSVDSLGEADDEADEDTMHVVKTQVSLGHCVTEVVKSADGESHVLQRTVMEQPPIDVCAVTFKGPNAEAKMEDYVRKHSNGHDVQASEYIDSEGNVIKRKVITASGAASADELVAVREPLIQSTEKMDTSCEETYDETDEFGNRRTYVIKRSFEEPSLRATRTIEVISQRRHNQGVCDPTEADIFVQPRDVMEEEKQKMEAGVSGGGGLGHQGGGGQQQQILHGGVLASSLQAGIFWMSTHVQYHTNCGNAHINVFRPL